jgi:hypothetical protein
MVFEYLEIQHLQFEFYIDPLKKSEHAKLVLINIESGNLVDKIFT